jgi:hypothetical protein
MPAERTNMQSYGPTLGSPEWMGDFASRDHLIPAPARLEAAQFYAPDAVSVVVGAAGALAAATSVPVDALSGAIPSGTVLNFGTNKFARLTAAAAAGATSITVAAIPTALVDNDTAIYPGVGAKSVPSGTVIGRTIAERDAGTGYGPAIDTDDEIYIIPFDIEDVALLDDCELYRHNSAVKENYLPGWTGLASGLKDKIRELYRCYRGAE